MKKRKKASFCRHEVSFPFTVNNKTPKVVPKVCLKSLTIEHSLGVFGLKEVFSGRKNAGGGAPAVVL